MRPQRELALVPHADEPVGLRRRAGSWRGVSPEAALVRRARSGDVDAFADLYNTHRSAILATCLKRLRDREAAEDAVQDTFLRAYASLSSYDERRPLGAWLNSIAVHRCIDVLRQSARTEVSDEVEDHLPRDVESDPTLGAVIALEERGRLRRALRQLHPRQRRALLLYALEGWSCAEVAAAEGISVGAAKSLLFHARANLRRTCRRGVLGTIVAALVGMRRRATRGAMAIRNRMTAGLEPLNLSVAPVSSGIAAVVLSLTAVAAP
ncbi:MAG: RNA polymerase sigma factor, partial [Actinomycetota bacterium]